MSHYRLSDRDVSLLRQQNAKLRNVRGPGVRNHAGGITFDPPPAPPAQAPDPSRRFEGFLISNSASGGSAHATITSGQRVVYTAQPAMPSPTPGVLVPNTNLATVPCYNRHEMNWPSYIGGTDGLDLPPGYDFATVACAGSSGVTFTIEMTVGPSGVYGLFDGDNEILSFCS